MVRKKASLKPTDANSLLLDIKHMIEQAREHVARSVNIGTTSLYWHIGRRIKQEVLKGKRADYGKRIVSTLSKQLVRDYGRGYSKGSLSRMVTFYEYFQDVRIVATLSQQLTWSHFIEILPLKDSLQRDFYAEMCRIENWNVRTLRRKIAGMLYERTALSKKPEKVIKQEIAKLKKTSRMTPDMAFRDPYFLDFLGLKGAYQEKDMEAAILREMESFILELGAGFSFLERQKRITIDGQDYYMDLLFYHRDLHRLVIIDLKLGKFKAAYKGQMELYLRWLEKYERKPGEKSPIGLILCAGKSEEQIELLELSKSGIRVSEYITQLPPRQLLEQKLHQALQLARLSS